MGMARKGTPARLGVWGDYGGTMVRIGGGTMGGRSVPY